VPPRLSLFVCGVQRSGTWLLAHLLRSTGVAGRPAEYFSPDDLRRFRAEWGVVRDDEYLARVLEEGTTPNGVFAAKLMWNTLESFLFRLRRLAREYDAADAEVIGRFFREPRYVWIRREDALAQAVSWAKAAQTGQYAAHQEATREPAFDFDQIDGLLHLARVHDGCWRRWFDAQGVVPLRVTYEELCADGRGVTLRLLGELGLAARADVTIAPPPELTKQADAVNAEWIERYRELAAKRDLEEPPRASL